MLNEEDNLERFNSENQIVELPKFNVTINDKIEKGDAVIIKNSGQKLSVTHTNYELHPKFEFAGFESLTGHTCIFNRKDIESVAKNQEDLEKKGGKGL